MVAYISIKTKPGTLNLEAVVVTERDSTPITSSIAFAFVYPAFVCESHISLDPFANQK